MGARGGGGEPPPSAGDGEGDRSALTGGSAKKARSCSGLANRVRIACVAAQCGESDDAECEGEEGGTTLPEVDCTAPTSEDSASSRSCET